MIYATAADIDVLYGNALLDQISDTTGTGERDEAAIARAFVDSHAMVDSYVGVKHPLPLSSVPGILKNLTIDVAVHRLAHRPGDMTDEIQARYEAALTQLKDISAGRASLGFAVNTPQATAAGTPQIVSNPRIFSRDTMRDM